MIYVLLDHPALAKADLSSLEYLLYGASAMSPSRLVEGIERIGPVFAQLYGQTECHPVSVLRKAEHDRARPELFESCGVPIAACQVKILDENDQETPVVSRARSACALRTSWPNTGNGRSRPPRP
jgi:fatty-acyl-CoA synthase